jgi:hypothetical protein
VGSDGGVIRVNLKHPADQSSQCAQRRYDYGSGPQPLEPADLKDCQSLLDGIPSHLDSLNKGLNTIQFQSLSVNPSDPKRELLGGTQDNGTFNYTANPTWTEVVGGDGAQSGFNPDNGSISYHTYYDATPGVNFNNNNPAQWHDTYDPLQASPENRSFMCPSSPIRTSPGGYSSGCSTSGAPTTTGAPRPISSPTTATPCTSIPAGPHAAIGCRSDRT